VKILVLLLPCGLGSLICGLLTIMWSLAFPAHGFAQSRAFMVWMASSFTAVIIGLLAFCLTDYRDA
jgi:hypothetical protein